MINNGVLEIRHTEILTRNQEAYNDGYKFIVNTGGSRSSKSMSILQLIIMLCLTTRDLKVSIVRQSLPSLRKSIMKDFFKLLQEYNIYDEKDHQKTESSYTFPLTGSTVEFFGVTDGQRIRGAKRDILFCNEGNELSLEAFNQLMMRTTKCCFIDRNPSEIDHWIDDFIENNDEAINIHSTFLDNPFLGKPQVDYIKNMINIDPNYYRIYALGLSPTDSVRIYSHFQKFTEIEPYTDWAYGLDIGFAHKSALVKCCFVGNKVYVYELLYESNFTSTDLIGFIKEHINDRKTIYCDSARPDIIEDLKRSGLNARGSDKDVKAGINTVRSKEILIDINGTNLWDEYRGYVWKTDSNGKSTDQPVKINDDAMDALRYCIHTHKGRSGDINTMKFY